MVGIRGHAAHGVFALFVVGVTLATSGVGARVGTSQTAGSQGQSNSEPNLINRELRAVFSKRNPAVTRVAILELRSVGMGAGPYVLLGRGIRPDLAFQGRFDDELFGLFLVDSSLTRIEHTFDIFPTQRWNDYIVSIERLTASEVTIVGAGSYGDQKLRRTFKLQLPK